MGRYYLRRDVYLSITGNAGILLDLGSGDYIGLNSAQVRCLSNFVRGWPAQNNADNCSGNAVSEKDAQNLADTLLARGLFTSDASNGKPAHPVALDPAEERFLDRDSVGKPDIAPHHLLNFVWSCLFALASVRLCPVGKILGRVARRNSRHQGISAREDFHKAQRLLNVFFHLRPFFYASKDQCLFDSFVLVEFLSRYRIYPQWVLGVKSDPFAAHSWVQHERYVLNGAPQVVRRFSPIVTV